MVPIDWDATGSMMSGLGTWAGAGAVAYAAWVGRNTFNAWREQRAEGRRMDAAERILTLAYKLKDNFKSVRAPFIPQAELEAGEEVLRKVRDEWWNGLEEPVQQRYRTAQAILNRLNHFSPDFQEIWEVKPIALAYFGEVVAGHLGTLWAKKASLAVSADAYAQDDGSDPQFSINLRRELWGGDADNELTLAISDAVAALEQLLLPVIRGGRQVSAR
jgi:hypothetical protein